MFFSYFFCFLEPGGIFRSALLNELNKSYLLSVSRASGKSSDYDVNDAERGGKRSKASSNGAKDNRGFVGDSSAGGNTEKWVSNYVPYGDFPAGSGGSGGEAPQQQQQQQNGEASWKKNYVPYKEGGGGTDEVDSNKKE